MVVSRRTQRARWTAMFVLVEGDLEELVYEIFEPLDLKDIPE
jgi:hypothetical protein